MIGFLIMLSTIKLTTNEKINAIQRDIDEKNKLIDKFSTLEKDAKAINTRLSGIDSLLSTQLDPNNILDKISNKIGPNIILKSIELNQPTLAKTTTKSTSNSNVNTSLAIVINGTAKARNEVIDFKRALEADTSFNSVVYTMSDDKSETNTASTDITFTINLNYAVITTGAKTK